MYRGRRLGVANISKTYLNEFVRHGLVLPVGYLVRDIHVEFARQTIQILIEGPDLPITPPGVEVPELSVTQSEGQLSVISWKAST